MVRSPKFNALELIGRCLGWSRDQRLRPLLHVRLLLPDRPRDAAHVPPPLFIPSLTLLNRRFGGKFITPIQLIQFLLAMLTISFETFDAEVISTLCLLSC